MYAAGWFCECAAKTPTSGPSIGTLSVIKVDMGRWYYAGPFDNTAGQGFAKKYPPEDGVDLTKTYDGKSNTRVAWKECDFPDRTINNLKLFGGTDNDHAAVYLYREITALEASKLPISLGSDDGLKVWFNGQLLLSRDIIRGCEPSQEHLTLQLKPGKNTLLLKICQGAGDWAFYFFAMVNADGFSKPTPEQAKAAVEASRKFIAETNTKLRLNLHVTKTAHFIIASNWPQDDRTWLAEHVERMYSGLARQFNLDSLESVWIGKMAFLAFEHEDEYVRFAKEMHGAPPIGAGGTCWYGPAVHIGLFRTSEQKDVVSRAALGSLVIHEGAHAFLNGYRSPAFVPSWVHEGLSQAIEQIAAPKGHKLHDARVASVDLARNVPAVQRALRERDNIPFNQYPMAMTLTQMLLKEDHKKYVTLINDIKDGFEGEAALKRNFGCQYDELAQKWADWIQSANRFAAIAYAPSTGSAGFSRGFNSRAGAEKCALDQCKGNDKRIVIWVQDGHCAMAKGARGGWGTGWGVTEDEAKAEALRQCAKVDTGCKICVCTSSSCK